MVGAHLDSVPAGPGINDNGSGSATLLETAIQMSKCNTPRQQVRFAFWGAEIGSAGSTHYVEASATRPRKDLANLNFDMLGSPNYVRFVYDGDGSADRSRRPNGSAADRGDLHQLLRQPGSAHRRHGIRRPFGLRALHRRRHPGRRAVQRRRGHQDSGGGRDLRRHGRGALRLCYHQACDTIKNVNEKAIDEMSDAVAHAIITYAFDTSSLQKPVNGPVSGTPGVNSTDGGLHDHDHEVAS